MKNSVVVYQNVEIGEDSQIGDFVIIGEPPRASKDGALETKIGNKAIIRSHTVIYSGNVIGDDFQTGHGVMIRELNNIGNDVSIGTKTVIEHHVLIEDSVRIHSQAFIPETTILRKGCWIGPNVVITNAYHPLCPKAKECLKGPEIGEEVKIGANATILPNLKIGKMALIGAGSVVISDIPEYMVAVGNPAKVIKHISELKCPYGLIDKPY